MPPITQDTTFPLVSIVTPSYNQGHFIRETIESVLNQNYPNIEYWVIDGGSTDNTISILKDYEYDLRFNWISESDSGQSNAINKGWCRCKGDILAWLNSDDTYLTDAIKHQVDALMRNEKYGVVYGDAVYIDENSKHLSKWHGSPYSVLELLRLSLPAQPTVFIRRWVIEKIGLLDEDFQFSMDTDYWIRASKITDFWYEPKLIATYRLHRNSKTVSSYSGFYQDWFKITANYFNCPSLSDVERSQKNKISASLYGKIAAIEAESGSIAESISYFRKALLLDGIRPRTFKVLIVLLERFLPLKLTPLLTARWTYKKSTRSK